MRKVIVLANDDGAEGSGLSADVCEVLESGGLIAQSLAASGRFETRFECAKTVADVRQIIATQQPDGVFNLVESLHQNTAFESAVAYLLEQEGIPFTGSSSSVLRNCLDKGWSTHVLNRAGVSVPWTEIWATVRSGDGVPLPAIVKPLRTDASIGITKDAVVWDVASLRKRAGEVIEEFGGAALVQAFVDGREINVGILGNNPPMALPLREIDFSQFPPGLPRVVTYDAKWTPSSPEYEGTSSEVANLPDDERRSIVHTATRAFITLGMRDYGRIDIRVDRSGRPHVIDLNANCDLNPDAGFMRSCELAGMDHQEVATRIMDMALGRGQNGEA